MKSSILFFALVAYSVVSGQERISSRQIFSKTILLETSKGGHATGFITIYKDNYLLVTATHVVNGLDTTTQMYYFDTAAINKNISLPARSKRLIDFFPSKSIAFQNEHIEGDVYIIRLFPKTKDDSTWLQVINLPFQNINPDLVSISRDIDITVYGYPLYDKALFEPITFKSTLSSGILRLPRADNKKLSYFYLLQDPGMQGFSGGPVFVGAETSGIMFGPDRTWLIGLVHGTFGDVSGGKYAAITPSAYIVDLIKSAYK
jgi:hypothetical protein